MRTRIFVSPLGLAVIFFLLAFTGYGQTRKVKEQIGHSQWFLNGKGVSGEKVSYIISFDRHGRKTREWQAHRDQNGELTDTSIAWVDTKGNLIHLYAYHTHTFYDYDSLGNEIAIKSLTETDTTNNLFTILYNADGRAKEKYLTINGVPYSEPIRFLYSGDTIITEAENYLNRVVKDKRGQYLFTEDRYLENDASHIVTAEYLRDGTGNVLLYVSKKDGAKQKETRHSYRNGQEVAQEELYFDPNYVVKTRFSYTYW